MAQAWSWGRGPAEEKAQEERWDAEVGGTAWDFLIIRGLIILGCSLPPPPSPGQTCLPQASPASRTYFSNKTP